MPETFDNEDIMATQLVEGNPVATLVIDAQHRVTHWNRACALLTRVPALEMIGRTEQWRAFYPSQRPILADLIVNQTVERDVDTYYRNKSRPSNLIEGAWEVEDFFPNFGHGGCWLFFTAAPLRNSAGAVIGAIETLQDVTQRRVVEDALRQSEERYRLLSLTDALTGLYNSRHLQDRLGNELMRAKRYSRPLSVLALDCDNFKSINDCFGHLEGDKVLRTLAGTIEGMLRRSDAAFRYGGEEFVVLLPEADGAAALCMAERLREGFAAQKIVTDRGQTMQCTVSIGVTQFTAGDDLSSFIRRADEACYAAKRHGKNCCVMG